MASFREMITSIVQEQEESIKNGFSVDIKPDEQAVESLSIERRENELIVCQYYDQRGDLMRDPEVRFRIEDDEWIPISYRQDPSVRQCSTDGIEIAEYLQT